MTEDTKEGCTWIRYEPPEPFANSLDKAPGAFFLGPFPGLGGQASVAIVPAIAKLSPYCFDARLQIANPLLRAYGVVSLCLDGIDGFDLSATYETSSLILTAVGVDAWDCCPVGICRALHGGEYEFRHRVGVV